LDDDFVCLLKEEAGLPVGKEVGDEPVASMRTKRPTPHVNSGAPASKRPKNDYQRSGMDRHVMKWTQEQQAAAELALCEVVCAHNLPILFVTSPFFLKFCQLLNFAWRA